MRKLRKQALSRWLEAERRGDERVAERALGGLWRGLDRPAPRVGFARRALAGAGVGGRGLGWRLPGPAWASRGLLAAALTLIAVFVTTAPLSLVTVAGAWDRAIAGSIGLVAALSERLAHGLTAWNVATRVSESLLTGLTEPPVLAALGVSLMISLFAFGWLTQLLALERSTEHA